MKTAYLSLSDEVLDKIVQKILTQAKPEKIILFGSLAHGKATSQSDIDLLLIFRQLTVPRRFLRRKIRAALREFLIPKDIIIATMEEIERWKAVPQAFLTKAIKEGRVLYERQGRAR